MLCLAAYSGGSPCEAQYSFRFRNTYDRWASYQFFSSEHRRWESPDLELNRGSEKWHTLSSRLPYLIELTDGDGYRERFKDVDLYPAVQQVYREDPDAVITLDVLYAYETRSKTVPVSKVIPIVRTRTVTRRGSDGRYYTFEETYTEYETVYEEKEIQYTVRVPTGIAVRPVTGGQRQDLADWEQAFESPEDPRRRQLGVTVATHPQGVIVRGREPGSAAERFRLLGPDDGKRFRVRVNRNVITQVNGEAVTTLAGFVEAVQSSPPVITLRVLDITTGRSDLFRTQLDMTP